MRLYRILETGWAGTQDDAKIRSKEAGRPWHVFDVPTDKPGLLAFLEERNVPASESELGQVDKPRELLEPEPMDAPPAPAEPPRQQLQDSYTASDIEDFILNRANVAQASNIMACLGSRFAELVKEKR
jgi:hypothetical protein